MFVLIVVLFLMLGYWFFKDIFPWLCLLAVILFIAKWAFRIAIIAIPTFLVFYIPYLIYKKNHAKQN